MVKNLIRNGGFERGDTEFWAAYDAKSFEVVASPVHRGTYAGKIVVKAGEYPYLITNDYFELTVGEIAYFEARVHGSDMMSAYLRVEYYDEGLNTIETVTYEQFNPATSGFAKIMEPISGIDGAKYCRPYIYLIDDNEDDFMVVDSVQMYKFRPEDAMGGIREMDKRTGLDTAGAYTSDWYFVAPFKEAEFKLYVGTLTGTADTLDVTIESKSPFSSAEHVIATFAQVTGSDILQILLVTAGLGTKIRVRAVLAGTGLNCTYYVIATYKR